MIEYFYNAQSGGCLSKKCIICRKEFEPYVPHQNCCGSHSCKKEKARLAYYKRNNKKERKQCLECGASLEHKSGQAKYCSKSCAKKAAYKRLPLVDHICEHCGSNFQSKNKNTKYCSNVCAGKATNPVGPPIKLNCEYCGTEFEIPFHLRKRGRRFCSQSCASSGENNAMFGNNLLTDEQIVEVCEKYNEGLNSVQLGEEYGVSTDTILRHLKLNDVEIRNDYNGENNPMYGKTHTKEVREMMSEIVTSRHLSGTYNDSLSQGSFASEKMGKVFWYKSSWELEYMKWCENNEDVLLYEYEPFSIEYYHMNNLRHYIPDFLVCFNDGSRKLVEIKPSCFLDAQINLDKFKAAREYCQKLLMEFEVLSENNIAQIITENVENNIKCH